MLISGDRNGVLLSVCASATTRRRPGRIGSSFGKLREARRVNIFPFGSIAKRQHYKWMPWIVELLDDRVRDELEALPLDMQARFVASSS
jgi:hypothetical protein